MALKVQIENELLPLSTVSFINALVDSAQSMALTGDEQLDQAARLFRKHGWFAYRGGSHVGLHQANVYNEPVHDRSVLITVH